MKLFKTFTASLLALAVSASVGILTASASIPDFTDCEDNGVDTIKIAKPMIDGELDTLYKNSLILGDLGREPNAYGTEWPGTAEADIYFLHDRDYLYICAVVEDDDVLTKGEAYATGENPYSNDCIEFRLSLDSSKDTVKVSVDAYGYNCFGLLEDYSVIDYDSIVYETKITSDGYVVEVAIPYSGDSYDLADEGALGFTYQLNDIDKDGNHFNHTTSFNGEAEKEPVFYALEEYPDGVFTDCEDNRVKVIKNGTAFVDGHLDYAYTKSLILGDLGRAPNAYGTEWSATAEADVYFLYDDEMLYICAVVEDDDVLTKGEAYATSENPYLNDCIEFRLSLDGSYDTVKVSVDAYGYNCFGLDDDYDKLDYSAIDYATTYTDTGYVVEVAVPCTTTGLNMFSAGELGFTYQLNDINSDYTHFNHTTSFRGEAVKRPVFYALSDERAIPFTYCEDNGVDTINLGTPVVDGELDALYRSSLILGNLGREPNAYGTVWPGTAEADIYLVHDRDYLYICAVVEDDDVLTKGEAYATGENPYSNDCIEFRLSLDGSKDTVKVSVDAYGYNCFGLTEDYSVIDYDSIVYETKITSDGYIVEVAIPYSGDSYDLTNESVLGFTYQLNDIDKYGNHFNHTTSFEGEDVKEPVFYELCNSEEETAAIRISSAQAVTGEIVKVKVVLENNPGIAAMRLNIGYNSDAFTLKSVEDGGLLGSVQHSNNFNESPYVLCWNNSTVAENLTTSGVIATLTFLVAEDAPEGEYDFTATFSPNDILDVNIKPVDFTAYDGTVKVTAGLLGDATGDDATDMADLMYFSRYLAKWAGYDEETVNVSLLDLNLDGKVTPLDAIVLTRHLANWIGYETLPYNPA